MLTKRESKDIQSLRSRQGRDDSGLFVVEGIKVVEEWLREVPGQIVAVYTEKLAAAFQTIAPELSVVSLTAAEMERITSLPSAQDAIAVLRYFPSVRPEPSGNWCMYLDAVQDPGNVGTIIRLADWFGVPHLVLGAGSADPYNPKVVQSSMASLSRVNVWKDDGDDWLAAQTAPIYATALEGESILGLDALPPGIVVVGNESKGVRPLLLAAANRRLTIPRRGRAESLNAAVATGIVLSRLVG